MAKNRAEENRDLILAGAEEAKPKKTKKKRSVVKDESPDRPVATRKKGENYAKPDRKDGHPWGGTGKGNPSHANLPPEAFCTAKRAKDGKPCRQLKITGADVCGTHGGRAPQVMRKAMARLQNSADKLVQGLLDIASDEDEPTTVRLAALRDALDRAGIKSTEKVDIAHSLKPWEQVMASATRVAPLSEEPTDPAILELRKTDDRY